MRKIFKITRVIILIMAVILFAVAMSSMPIFYHYNNIFSGKISKDHLVYYLEDLHSDSTDRIWNVKCTNSLKGILYKYEIPCELLVPYEFENISEYIQENYNESYYLTFDEERSQKAMNSFLIPMSYLIIFLSAFLIFIFSFKKNTYLKWFSIGFFLSSLFLIFENFAIYWYSQNWIITSINKIILEQTNTTYVIGLFYFLISALLFLIHKKNKKL